MGLPQVSLLASSSESKSPSEDDGDIPPTDVSGGKVPKTLTLFNEQCK